MMVGGVVNFLESICKKLKHLTTKKENKYSKMKAILLNIALFFMTFSCAAIFNKESKNNLATLSTSVEQPPVNDSIWDNLLQKHVDKQGNVNYKGFLKDRTQLKKYLNQLSDNPPQTSWSRNETLAYYINVYNAFTVELILENYPVKSIKDIRRPWGRKFFKLGDTRYSLNNIEHDILRKMDEPRIHFAINCASVSCPKLYNKAFTASKLEEQLDTLTRYFINSSENKISENELQLSNIFKWYEKDYLIDGIQSLAQYVIQYTDVKINPNAKVSFLDYNWDLNEKK